MPKRVRTFTVTCGELVRLHVGALHCSVNSMFTLTSFGGIRSWSSHDQAALVKYEQSQGLAQLA